MSEAVKLPDFNSSIVEHARKDFPLLDAQMSVAEALDRIRREGVGERVIYFFATDTDGRLVGVLPTRRLLTAPERTVVLGVQHGRMDMAHISEADELPERSKIDER